MKIFVATLLCASSFNCLAAAKTVYITMGGNGPTRPSAIASAEAKASAECKNVYSGTSAPMSSYVYTQTGVGYGAIARVACTYDDGGSDPGIGVAALQFRPATSLNNCLEVNGLEINDGAAVQTGVCGTGYGPGQLWYVDPGHALLIDFNSAKPLTVGGSGVDNGSPVEIWDIGSGRQQLWSFTNVILQGPQQKALQAVNLSDVDSTPIQLWPKSGAAGQQWNYDLTSSEIKGISNSKCLDVAGGIAGSGVDVVIATCNGSITQKWELGRYGSLRNSGYCLTIVDPFASNGAPVKLQSCDKSAFQAITFLGEVRSLGSNRCLTTASANVGSLQTVSDCDGRTEQKWQFRVLY